MRVTTGLEALLGSKLNLLKGKKLGIVCNQATVDPSFTHLLFRLLPGHTAGEFNIHAVFGPQHGIWGHTQDNMIEWEGYTDPLTGLKFHSLYGEHREPTPEMLEGIELLVVDLPDIGARYYTFLWTLALCMKACEPLGIPILVLDRPNPIGGTQVEGTMLDPALDSFVGLYPIPTRHGLTLGEAALYLQKTQFPRASLSVVPCENWRRQDYADAAGTPWVMPSPNMPTLDTAVVYPGMCLIEGTQLSEGRGTTRPFEMFGASYLDGFQLAKALNGLSLPGIIFRPITFLPTFHKFAGEVCEGCQMHVTNRSDFEPVLAATAVIQEVIRQAGSRFEWRPAPYEYVWDKEPIDILAGQMWVRPAIENLMPISEVRERMQAEVGGFHNDPSVELLYTA